MARAKIILKRPITDIDIDVDENHVEFMWTPCSIVNGCFIPELENTGYCGVLFTYLSPKGKRLVREAWVENGRLVGKQMAGTPIAYMKLPEPYKEDTP